MSETQLIAITGTENVNRIADVIFVHGLGGDALSTWHPQQKPEFKNSWLAWLGNDIKDIGIWSVDYQVEAFKWKGGTMPLADRATNIIDLLDIYEIGERPVIFITHSMGGLVVKQLLRHAYDYGNPSWKKIVEQTRGIVFLSTPHSGANIANWLQYIKGIIGNSVSVDELQANDPRLRELNTVYRNHAQLKKIPIIVYCENQPTSGVLVVDQTSADPGIPGVTAISLDENHISIAKPKSNTSRLYLRVRKFIKENISSPPPLPLLHSQDKIPQSELSRETSIKQGNYNENIQGNYIHVEGDYHQNSDSKKKA